ncbi:hypothetical protein KR222_001471, partial [Zaprionus bogoriensis]
AMTRILKLTYPASPSVQVRSRESCTYLYRVMKFLGYFHPEKRPERYIYILWQCLVFGVSVVYLPIAFALNLIIDFEYLSAAEFLTIMQSLINTIGATAKSFIGLIFFSQFNRTESLLDLLDEKLRGDSDRRKINAAVALCNRIFSFYAILYSCYTVLMVITGIVVRRPPWMVYNPFFSWRDGERSIWMQTILEFIMASLVITVELVWDTYNLVFAITFRAHIHILKDHIQSLRIDPQKTEDENYVELVECIRHHKLILKCCALMNPIISRTIFTQFLLIGIVLGLTLANVLISGIVRGFTSIVFFIGVLLETFPFCYLCDLLVEDCNELSNSLVQSHWIGAEPKYKSTLRIFLQHLQQPIRFIAGGIFHITMGSNIKVAKFAFSVTTIVQNMNLAERFQ